MITKTSGIVLGKIKFRETSIIVRIFTDKFGLQSYLVNGIRSPRGKFRIALFQPLTLLDLVVYYKENAGIQRLSEVKCSYPYSTISGNMKKSAVIIFLTEMLEKTLRDCSNPEEVFAFLQQSLIRFDTDAENQSSFHLKFLIEFSAVLGFKPQSIVDFKNHIPSNLHSSGHDALLLIKQMIENKTQKIPFSSNMTRRNCLNLIIAYYKGHIDNLGEIKSVSVLKEILD